MTELSPRETLIRAVTARISDRKTAEALVSAYYRATKDERDLRPDSRERADRIVAAYERLIGVTRPTR